jgi:hypothetical protein
MLLWLSAAAEYSTGPKAIWKIGCVTARPAHWKGTVLYRYHVLTEKKTQRVFKKKKKNNTKKKLRISKCFNENDLTGDMTGIAPVNFYGPVILSQRIKFEFRNLISNNIFYSIFMHSYDSNSLLEEPSLRE